MNRNTPPAALSYQPKLGLPARLGILAGIVLADKLLLNNFVDFERAEAAQGFAAVVRDVHHWGFRFAVAMMAAIVLFAHVRGAAQENTAAVALRDSKVRVPWLLVHAALLACLMPLSYGLYRDVALPLSFAVITGLWVTCALCAVASAVLALAPWAQWRDVARGLGSVWSYSAMIALSAVCAMFLSQRLWAPMAAVTFKLVRFVLLPILPNLSSDAATRTLGTDRFAVEISDECSGLEGLGLMLAFSVLWLIYFRREYLFPRAFLLIPAGLLAIFALNVVRIAVLLMIGDAGFPDVAVFGFHSQAGWIAFNAVACGLVYFSRRSVWLNHTSANAPVHTATDNPTAPYLMPLLSIMIAGSLSHAMSGPFETFYPLRLLAGIGALWVYRYKLATLDWRFSWRAPLVGCLVFLIWILGAHLLMHPTDIPVELASMPRPVRSLWLFSRIAASVVLVPIAEELAYRGYLMRRLGHRDFDALPFRAVHWLPMMATALAFGLAHGALWFPGILAGIAYGTLLVRTGSIGEAAMAHATTNALVAVAVIELDQWQLW